MGQATEKSPMPELLAEIVRRIRAVSDPEQIILFGSQARGDFRPDSDLDLLVIKREVDSTLYGRSASDAS